MQYPNVGSNNCYGSSLSPEAPAQTQVTVSGLIEMLITIMVRLVMQVEAAFHVDFHPNLFQVDSSHAFTEMTIQYLLELEWTARTVLSNLNRRLSLPQLPAG